MLKPEWYQDLIQDVDGLRQLQLCSDVSSFLHCLRRIFQLEHCSDIELHEFLEYGNSVCFEPQLTLFNQFWLPYAYKSTEQEVLWLPAFGRPTQSYFSDYVTEVQQSIVASLLKPKTRLKVLLKQRQDIEFSIPAGFIFHLSRCGSTLVSRSIAVSNSCRVIAESGLLTSVLQDRQLEDEERGIALKLLLALQGKLRDKEQHLVVKWNAWDLNFLQQIILLYPSVPLVFLTRQPLAILASHQKTAGWHMVPLMAQRRLFELVPDLEEGSLLHYQQLVLQHLMREILKYAALELALVIDYQQLPQQIEQGILPFFKLCFSDAELREMNLSQQRYSKNPELLFQPDLWKQSHFTAVQSEELRQQLLPMYQQLLAYASLY
ncbi:hypothetical protein [Rheinheimera sp.]|uniref:hypothetical protein n=1 Tax=Rheinheimera sp. TaxID=1869214 RepID=UPI00262ABB83|nr:hypothetical protein [Rheinheimera sp.]MCA1930481.1 hypothetical protein [Rheinheimera sp.]